MSNDWLTLDEGEEILWQGKPTPRSLYGEVALGVILLIVLIGAVILPYSGYRYFRLRHTKYVLTDEAIYAKHGRWTTTVETVSLDRIQNTEYYQSFLGTYLDYGNVFVATAGTDEQEVGFVGIEGAARIRDLIENAAINETEQISLDDLYEETVKIRKLMEERQ